MNGSGITSSSRRSNRGIIPISEVAHHVDEKVNMKGIVVEFSLPRKSCGTDFVSILKIVDHSRQSPELSVNIFTEKVGHLPVVKSHSDLIVLHNVLIKKHDGEVNAVFSKNFSSFA